MNCQEALAWPGTAALDPTSVSFSFTPQPFHPCMVFWDVTAMTRHLVASGTQPVRLPLAGLKEWFDDGRIEVDPEHAMSGRVDPRVPILVIGFDDGWLPVDGWHRVYQSIQRGLTTILALCLDPDEECRFRYPAALCEQLTRLSNDPQCQFLEKLLTGMLRRGGHAFILS